MDVAGLVGEKPGDGVGDLIGGAGAPGGDASGHLGDNVAVGGVDRGAGGAWGDSVDADAAGAELGGPAARELDLGGLGR